MFEGQWFPKQAIQFQGSMPGQLVSPFSLTQVSGGFSNSSSTAYITGLDFGPAPTGANRRFILVGYATQNSTGRNLDSATIGGVSASVLGTVGGNERASFAIAEVPTGTSGSFVPTNSGSISRSGYAYWIVINPPGLLVPNAIATDSTVASSRLDLDLNVPAGGAACAISLVNNGAAMTWTGLTKGYEQDINPTGDFFSTATDSFASAQTPLDLFVVPGASNAAAMAVSFG